MAPGSGWCVRSTWAQRPTRRGVTAWPTPILPAAAPALGPRRRRALSSRPAGSLPARLQDVAEPWLHPQALPGTGCPEAPWRVEPSWVSRGARGCHPGLGVTGRSPGGRTRWEEARSLVPGSEPQADHTLHGSVPRGNQDSPAYPGSWGWTGPSLAGSVPLVPSHWPSPPPKALGPGLPGPVLASLSSQGLTGRGLLGGEGAPFTLQPLVGLALSLIRCPQTWSSSRS